MRSVFTEDNLTDVIFYNATPESSFAGTKAEARALARAMQAAPALAEALDAAGKGFAAILDNHPDVSPPAGFVAGLTPERKAWRDKIKGFVKAARAALKAAGIEE